MARLGPVIAVAVCVTGVALGDIDLHFCVASVAHGDIDLHSAGQAWHLWHWDDSGGALGSRDRCGCLRDRRGTW